MDESGDHIVIRQTNREGRPEWMDRERQGDIEKLKTNMNRGKRIQYVNGVTLRGGECLRKEGLAPASPSLRHIEPAIA